jgi:site-specific recombinase XerD
MGEVRLKVPRLRTIAGAYYWRPTKSVKALGFVSVPLGKDAAAAIDRAKALNEAVTRAKAGKPAQPVPGTIAAVIRSYTSDDNEEWTSLSEGTKPGYLRTLKAIEKVAGHVPVANVTRVGLKATYKALRRRGLRTAAEHMKMWRLILGHAYDAGLRPDNPALKMKIKHPKARHQKWTFDELMIFCGAALEMGRPSMFATALLEYGIGQRVGDVRLLPLATWSDGCFWVRQSKTGELVAVELEPWLKPFVARLHERLSKTQLMFIINENTGKPYTMTNFSHVFAAVRKRAGLSPNLLARDLRRTVLSEANAGGASQGDMQGLGGHKSLQSLSIYVVPTEASAARAQQARTRGRDRVAKLAELDRATRRDK